MYGFRNFYKIFFLSLVIGFFIFIPRETYALDFTDCNNVSHNVTDLETLRDYTYFTYVNDVDKPLFSTSSRTGVTGDTIYEFFIPLTSPSYLVKYSNSNFNFKTIENDSFSNSSCTTFIANFNNSGIITNLQENITCSRMYSVPNVFIPDVYSSNLPLTKITDSNYSYQDILTKYSCSGSPVEPEPVIEEDFNMFELALTLLIQFINCITIFFSIYIVFDILGMLLFSRRG